MPWEFDGRNVATYEDANGEISVEKLSNGDLFITIHEADINEYCDAIIPKVVIDFISRDKNNE